jgi:hypothetical protein
MYMDCVRAPFSSRRKGVGEVRRRTDDGQTVADDYGPTLAVGVRPSPCMCVGVYVWSVFVSLMLSRFTGVVTSDLNRSLECDRISMKEITLRQKGKSNRESNGE